MQKLMIWLLIALGSVCVAVPIAWVEDMPIESSEFQETIAEIPDSLNQITRRQIALERLIEEKLLLLYSQEQQIEVSPEETEGLFINTLSDHPMFQENGEFSYALFEIAKKRPEIQKILESMQQDILVEKTRALIRKKLELSDEQLLERFFLENVKIDISYAQFDLEDVAISPQLTARGALNYYKKNRDRFVAKEEINLGITYIRYNDFRTSAELNIADQFAEITPVDLIMEGSELDSLQLVELQKESEEQTRQARERAIEQEARRLARAEAEYVRHHLSRDLPIRYPRLSTGFISEGSSAGRIPSKIIQQALRMKPGEIAEPYEANDGLIIFWLIEKNRPALAKLNEIKDEVWDAYIEDVDFQENEDEFKRYFYDHLDEFKVPALIVNRIDLVERLHGRTWPLGKDQAVIIAKLEKYLFNEEYLEWAAQSSGLQMQKEIIYLDKYPFLDEINRKIAQMVQEDVVYGVVEADGLESFYVLNSIYPSYIPDFDVVLKSGYFQAEIESRFDESSFMEYYEQHKNDFTTPDSISIGVVHFPLEPDSVYVSSNEIEDYYLRNQGKYYHEAAANCTFLVCFDLERARLAFNYLKAGYDYELVKWCFADTVYQIADGLIEYKDLPEEIRSEVKNLPENHYLASHQIDKGRVIIGKKRELPKGYYPFSEVREEIKDIIQNFKADSLAYSRARAVFDSTTYFGECYSYADSQYIFQSPLQSIYQDYPGLGSLKKYHSALMQLWRNEKLTQIVNAEDGYAVIFMRKKVSSKELSYKESLEQIREIFAANYKLERARKYINSLIEDLQRGIDADSLLLFLGGLKHAPDITLNSTIPGFEHSRLLIEDMTRHEPGYYSPVLKVAEGRLMFYRINDMNKVTRQDFYRQEAVFRRKIEEQDYQAWLKDYRQTKRIKR